MKKYIPSEFEQKWVEDWDKKKIYKTPTLESKVKSRKSYIFPMFPYPSGAGLHVGHVRVYTGTDVIARFHRMSGYAVLHPIGWDAFGLPAENAAIKAKKNPMDMVPDHIATFKRQMKSLGFSFDWDREFATTDPSYYKWTQWLFIQFYNMGLLYKKNAPINFCPFCKTGLSEEEVLPNGTHERCGTKIIKKDLPQWLFRITSYADRLLDDLKGLDWPKGILEMQKNWIGKSEGINFKEKVKDLNIEFEVFDSVPQTFIAQTFTVIAPEHPMVKELVKGTKYEQKVLEFVEKIEEKKLSKKFNVETDIEGIFTGRYVENPFGTGDLPIWVASFVLYDYGTGIVNCSGHDERDFAFAKKYDIPLRIVMLPKDKKLAEQVKNLEICYHHAEDGIIQDPSEFKGMTWKEAREPIIEYIEKKALGKRSSHYHLRDWIFSRQRYWGEPIPMIFCESCAKNQIQNPKSKIQNEIAGWYPVPESELPIKLPYVKSYEPSGTGESPLAAIKDWVNVKCPKCVGPAKRETDTMPNWAGSCWYFIAFAMWPKLGQLSVSIGNWKLEIGNWGNQWLPGDWYIGGAEHAVLHLLYARFWVKALYDLKLLSFKEPFTRLRNLGMILAEDHRKMSKSFGNVVNPDDVEKEYGADALRVYEMFMAPFDQEISWSTNALQGAYRFMVRVWKIYQQYKSQKSKVKSQNDNSKVKSDNNITMEQYNNKELEDKQLVFKLQKTIVKITKDIPDVKFNTAVAAMMEFINTWEQSIHPKSTASVDFGLSRQHAKQFLQILAPFAPFTAEEIWHEVFGEKESIHLSVWPKVNTKEIIETEVQIPVQVNGKVRAIIQLTSSESSKDSVVKKALADERVKKYVEGKKYKVIYVKGKILNLVLQEMQVRARQIHL